MTKKLFIKTYGCQMNAYDSLRMADVLAPLGYAKSDSVEGADMVILNTCHIREKAEDKVYSELGRVRQEKERANAEGRRMLIAVGGCVAQAEGEEIIRRAPYVDMVFGSQAYHQLPELVTRALEKYDQSSYAKASEDTPTPMSASSGEATRSRRRRVVELDFPEIPKFDFLPTETGAQGPSAFLAVQEGCDKFCTFCVVPYTRGVEYSRSVADVEQEARQLVDKGAVEITLLGQNVNAYHGADTGGAPATLAKLVARLSHIDGLRRIRYTTSHPRDMTDDLIAAHAEEEKLMPYLHLPIQSGSDAVLKRMNRKHDAAHYLDIIARLRKARPDMAFSGDFIVGFPGETEQDFEATLRVVDEVAYASAFSFKYSPRPGTPASVDEDQVPEEVKYERLQRLQARLRQHQLAFNESCMGRTMDVLLDREGKVEGQLAGKSPYLQTVLLSDAEQHRGKIVSVQVVAAYQNSLFGTVSAPAEAEAA